MDRIGIDHGVVFELRLQLPELPEGASADVLGVRFQYVLDGLLLGQAVDVAATNDDVLHLQLTIFVEGFEDATLDQINLAGTVRQAVD